MSAPETPLFARKRIEPIDWRFLPGEPVQRTAAEILGAITEKVKSRIETGTEGTFVTAAA